MKQKVLIGFLWIVSFLWLVVSFYLSWQTGEKTTFLSQNIAALLLKGLGKLGFNLDPQRFHSGLRLTAHFFVFFITGILIACLITVTFTSWKMDRRLACSLSFCTLIAVLAEVGKLLVPGRHLTWSEAGLNVVGAVCGILLAALLVRVSRGYFAR